jgi:hypothetical protein
MRGGSHIVEERYPLFVAKLYLTISLRRLVPASSSKYQFFFGGGFVALDRFKRKSRFHLWNGASNLVVPTKLSWGTMLPAQELSLEDNPIRIKKSREPIRIVTAAKSFGLIRKAN